MHGSTVSLILCSLVAETSMMDVVSALDVIAMQNKDRIKLFRKGKQVYPIVIETPTND